jgi:ribosomal protein S12 methylthiotransferase accessory factor
MPGTFRESARPGPARASLARALGVTRIARVTRLDRAGVEVACAVRPGGHVLQIANGKGRSFQEAAAGALLETAELACAEHVVAADLRWASEDELRERRARFVPAAELGGESDGRRRVAFREARDLVSGAEVLVPAAAVHVPPEGGPLLGLTGVRWTSNGMGAHPRWEAALLHALLEAVERHELARALPEGWTEEEVRARHVPPAALERAAPAVAALARRMERRGLEVHLFDLAPGDPIGLPVAGALLVDRERGPVPLTAGYAARLDVAHALEAALLEAAQSRLTDIHGAREDVGGMDERGVERLREACARARECPSPLPSPRVAGGGGRNPGRPKRFVSLSSVAGGGGRNPWRPGRFIPLSLEGRGTGRGSAHARVSYVVSLLHRAGFTRCAALDLAPADLRVHVAKVVAPGLLCSELL